MLRKLVHIPPHGQSVTGGNTKLRLTVLLAKHVAVSIYIKLWINAISLTLVVAADNVCGPTLP